MNEIRIAFNTILCMGIMQPQCLNDLTQKAFGLSGRCTMRAYNEVSRRCVCGSVRGGQLWKSGWWMEHEDEEFFKLLRVWRTKGAALL